MWNVDKQKARGGVGIRTLVLFKTTDMDELEKESHRESEASNATR